MRRTETPKPIWIKFCMMVDIADIVTYTNFGDHRLRGFWVAGVQIFPSPIDFHRRPYNILAVSLYRASVWSAVFNIYICWSGQLKCGGEPPTYRCISRFRLCDGYDDCGNGWDESTTTCGQLTELSYLLISRLPRHACYVFYSATLNRKGPHRRRIIHIFVPSRPICESLALAFL